MATQTLNLQVQEPVQIHAQEPAQDPFFILYASRSGSTFLANELTKRFNVVIAPESDFITYALDQYGHALFQSDAQLDSLAATIMSDPKFADLNVSYLALRAMLGKNVPLTLSDAVRLILDHHRRGCGQCGHAYGIKQGSYIHHYHDLLRLFPSAKFVGLIRDGRAVYHSQKHSISSIGKPMARDAKKAARRWVTLNRLLRELELDHTGVMIVNYETLIRDTEETLDQIGSFLEIEPSRSAAPTRWYDVPERYGRELHCNINKGPLVDRIAAWQDNLPPSEIAEYESIAHNCLVDEGYELLNPARSGRGWTRWFL